MRFLFVFFLVATLFGLSPSGFSQWYEPVEPEIEFTKWSRPEPPRLKDIRAAVSYLRAHFAGKKKQPKLTRKWRRDKGYRVLFLSVSDGDHPAKVVMGCGDGYRAALDQILTQVQEQPGLRDGKWLKLDVVSRIEKPEIARHAEPFQLDYTLEGIANGDGKWALLPGQILAHDAYDFLGNTLHGYALGNALRIGGRNEPGLAQRFRSPGLAVRRFRTHAFCFDGQTIRQLFRDHRDFAKFNLADLEEAMALGMAYLVRSTKQDGSFVYTYHDSGQPQYSLARHGGTLFAMADYYRDHPSPELLAAIERARDYLLAQIRIFKHDAEPVPVIVERGAIKLTVMALGLLSLGECYKLSGDPQLLETLRGLASYIGNSQLPNGRFYTRRDFDDGRWRKELESLYAPGEAIFGLANLYKLDPDSKWLEIGENGTNYLVDRQKKVPLAQMEHDHWLLYALNTLHSITPKPYQEEATLRLTRAIEQLQRKQSPIPDWIGSYYDPPRSTPTATRSEGLLSAHQMMVRAGRKKEARRIWDLARRSVSFQLQTQFRPGNAMYLPYPNKAVGGFRGSFIENTIRIDFVQHNVSALLMMARHLKSNR